MSLKKDGFLYSATRGWWAGYFRRLVSEEVSSQVAQLKKQLQQSPKTEKKESSKSATLHLLPKAKYQILEIFNPAIFFGVLDLSDLKRGDSLEIIVLLSAGPNESKINFRRVFTGPLEEPIIDMPDRFGSTISISLTQLTGVSCTVTYDLRWKDV